MNRLYIIVIVFILTLVILEPAYSIDKPQQRMPFNIYADRNVPDNHFIPSGWMGDYGAVDINVACTENPHSGLTCIKITYSGEIPQGAGWAGVYWQNPENNWGAKDGGFNLTAAKKLTFWARGEKGGEKLEFKVGGITGAYPDSDITGIGPIALTEKWDIYEIGLGGLDLSYISGGFVWAASRMDNPYGFVIYLDDIRYE